MLLKRPQKESGLLVRFGLRRPFLALFLLILLPNLGGSVFSFFYNEHLIVDRYMDAGQKAAFWGVAGPIYNLIAYPVCVGLMYGLARPLILCRQKLRSGAAIPPAHLEICRRRLLNLPFFQVCVNSLGWFPGAIFFPGMVCWLGGGENAHLIWEQFIISFIISGLITTVQTYFLVETFLIAFLYREFFQDGRASDVRGAIRIPFGLRAFLMWTAVAVMPMVGLLAVTLNLQPGRTDFQDLRGLAALVAVVGILSGGLVSWLGGRNMVRWIGAHSDATLQIARENFDVRIDEKRPDEWGRLTERFNDMARALGRGRQMHETFGQVVGPEVRDEIMDRYQGLGGEVQEVSVLFADIRGFTRRSAGEPPDRTVQLLNRFLTLTVRAVEENRGMVNKFLGDGIMALFGAPRPRPDHAELAVRSALDMLARLEDLNRDLAREGQEPLKIGIGIHTGPALVGCVGASLERPDCSVRIRKEFTAIGETVNLCQRIEQLTKTCGGPILLSEQTRKGIRGDYRLAGLGPQSLPGCAESLVIFRIDPYGQVPQLNP